MREIRASLVLGLIAVIAVGSGCGSDSNAGGAGGQGGGGRGGAGGRGGQGGTGTAGSSGGQSGGGGQSGSGQGGGRWSERPRRRVRRRRSERRRRDSRSRRSGWPEWPRWRGWPERRRRRGRAGWRRRNQYPVRRARAVAVWCACSAYCSAVVAYCTRCERSVRELRCLLVTVQCADLVLRRAQRSERQHRVLPGVARTVGTSVARHRVRRRRPEQPGLPVTWSRAAAAPPLRTGSW